jgi:hypothetical protein
VTLDYELVRKEIKERKGAEPNASRIWSAGPASNPEFEKLLQDIRGGGLIEEDKWCRFG